MDATDIIIMSMCELDRFKVIQGVADGLVKPWRAAQRLGANAPLWAPTVKQRLAAIRHLFDRLVNACAKRSSREPTLIVVGYGLYDTIVGVYTSVHGCGVALRHLRRATSATPL